MKCRLSLNDQVGFIEQNLQVGEGIREFAKSEESVSWEL